MSGQYGVLPSIYAGRSDRRSRNRSIDGWRGLSVSLVIIGHLVDFRYSEALGARPFRAFLADPHWERAALIKQIVLRILAALPSIGVDIFFIISGYLITSLLLLEESESGGVNLRAFYVRRIFRIVPTYYLYLLCVLVLASLNLIVVAPRNLALGASFLCDLNGEYCSWWLGHIWTLSVEEQFYLVWPAVFVLLRAGRVAGAALALVVFLAASLFYPQSLGFAHIAAGALYALSRRARRWIDVAGRKTLAVALSPILFLPPFFASSPILYNAISAVGLVVLSAIFFGALREQGPFHALVRSEWLGRFGVASYSIYIWQQMFLGEAALYEGLALLANPLLLIVPALLSYFAVERPSIALGRRISDAIKRRARDFPNFPKIALPLTVSSRQE